ncbi:MAG: hypothetical protein MZU97_20485 [Bacillus subtilis]|nr:hypothetical protein [Bacillus subtilis]
MAIPMIGILNGKDFSKVFVFELSFIVAIGLYLYIGYTRGAWNLAAASFPIPVVYGVLSGEIKIGFAKNDWVLNIALIASIAVYVGFGLWLATWGWLGVVFFATPVVAILRNARQKTCRRRCPAVHRRHHLLSSSAGSSPGAWAVSWLAHSSLIPDRRNPRKLRFHRGVFRTPLFFRSDKKSGDMIYYNQYHKIGVFMAKKWLVGVVLSVLFLLSVVIGAAIHRRTTVFLTRHGVQTVAIVDGTEFKIMERGRMKTVFLKGVNLGACETGEPSPVNLRSLAKNTAAGLSKSGRWART